MTTETTTETTKVHKFEQAGLGKAPFRIVGSFEAVYQACPGAPVQAGGTCDYCANGIRYVCRVRSADGREFNVGCDCAMSVGDEGLRKVAAKVQTKVKRDARHAAEQRKLDDLRARLADATTRAALAARPHPTAYRAAKGETLLSWAEWMAQNAGVTGRLEVLALIKKL
jgi:hypothetical protein